MLESNNNGWNYYHNIGNEDINEFQLEVVSLMRRKVHGRVRSWH
jgi:hypothetical protein